MVRSGSGLSWEEVPDPVKKISNLTTAHMWSIIKFSFITQLTGIKIKHSRACFATCILYIEEDRPPTPPAKLFLPLSFIFLFL